MNTLRWLAQVVIALLVLVYLYPLASGRALPNWRWLPFRGPSWPPPHVRVSSMARILGLLAAAVVSIPLPLDPIIRIAMAPVVLIVCPVLFVIGDGLPVAGQRSTPI